MSSLMSVSPFRWGLPFLVFASFFGPIAYADKFLAKDLKEKLASYLSSEDGIKPLHGLPSIIEHVFERLFGDRHFSLKCMRSSLLISTFALLMLLLFTALYSPPALPAFVRGCIAAYKVVLHNLAQKPKTEKLAENLSHLGFWRICFVAFLSWIFWSLIPDYLSLLKSRIIIIVLKNKPPSVTGLLVTLATDFVLSLTIFFVSAAAFQAVMVILLVGPQTSVSSLEGLAIGLVIVTPMVAGLEFILLVHHGAIFYAIPIANLFWASVIPAVWLWVYIAAALLTRFLIRSRKGIVWITRWIDVQNSPCTFVGLITGAVAWVVTAVLLVILSFYQLFA